MDPDVLTQENERLRQLNARLRSALEEVQLRLTEPEEIIRAIRQGEIDALVVQEKGQEEIYSLQHYDSVYRSMVEKCFPFGVWLAEPDGRLLYVSPPFLDLVHTSLAAMRKDGQFHFLPTQTREAVEREWTRCRETGEPLDVEYTVRFGDGPERAIWTRGVLTRGQGQQDHWVGVNIDVTERKRIKEEIHRQAETLREQAEALREADRRKDEFLALLGHELRNPLATIHNGLHVLLVPDIDPADLRHVKETMEKQVRHLTRLMDDLLDVSRITRGKIQLRKERVDLEAAAKHAVESVRPFMEAQRHKLSVLLPATRVTVEADPTRLEQVLVNLLNNAAKYTEPGGEISLIVAREGDEAVIRVRDNGIGIRPDLLNKVFELFVQNERRAGPLSRGPGDRLDAGQEAGRDARRPGRRVQRRHGSGQRVRGASPRAVGGGGRGGDPTRGGDDGPSESASAGGGRLRRSGEVAEDPAGILRARRSGGA